MSAKNLTWQESESIAASAAERATGFDKVVAGKSYTISGEDLQRILVNSAIHALRSAGCLEEQDHRDARRRDREVARIRREEAAFRARNTAI
jgi:hypothetical protein